MSLSCRLCQALVSCSKEEVDDFTFKLGQAISGMSKPPEEFLDASKYCVPCLNSAREKAKKEETKPPEEKPRFELGGSPVVYNM
jgi:hypothetical protein